MSKIDARPSRSCAISRTTSCARRSTRTRDELFRLHLGQHTNQVTSTAALTTKRRDIARILTILQRPQARPRDPGAEDGDRRRRDRSAPSEEDAKAKAKS